MKLPKKSKTKNHLPFGVYCQTTDHGEAPLYATFSSEKTAKRFVQAAREDLGEDFEPDKFFIVDHETSTIIDHEQTVS